MALYLNIVFISFYLIKNENQNDLDGQPSILLACMHVSNYKATFLQSI